MRWLDLYIDGMHRSSVAWGVGSRIAIGPFSRVGSIINVVFCAVVAVGGLWAGITGQAPGFVTAAFASVIEVVLVRICIRAFRGDFEDFVLDPDVPDGDVSDDETGQ